jgi:hypothetical protein
MQQFIHAERIPKYWMTNIYPPNPSSLEVGQRNKKELDIPTNSSHNTHVHPQNSIFPPEFPQQGRCSLLSIEDLILSLRSSKTPQHRRTSHLDLS